jgi:hypothetical protein
MSLREMTCARGSAVCKSGAGYLATHVLMLQMLQQLQFPVCSLGQDRGAEGLHDLLDGHTLPGELVFGGAGPRKSVCAASQEGIGGTVVPDKTECTHPHRLEVRVPAASISIRSGTTPEHLLRQPRVP